ncbi:NADPH-dependent FMN reductase [Nocardioides sp. zg-1228]|uniref:NADPH-dependent FMN reductase n=1 Tax=Nocardioides sp. zg-1228 TaxID=2763008 RepID=UPI001642D9DC|nr:NAD(P)H-dependent oxidoreductase [Nocardioides sp. zg-1228]MBC2931456.1 NAD(P)H-dependent oxidoreductase [Nocardioides sp. zg-1228]QSF57069.1 NAD(P)H-dependent oxidoreductase [Nocardioides sp. zg-1228]
MSARVAVVVGNPTPRSRTHASALAVADRLGGADLVVDLADHASEIFDPAAGRVADLVEAVAGSLVVVVASPTYKATYTGLLKAFLDRFPHQGLSGVTAIPLMLGASPAHSLATEHSLRPLLVELGASVPTRGLYVLDSEHDRPETYDAWFAAAHQLLPTLPAPTAHALEASPA